MMFNKFFESISGRYCFDKLYYHRDHVKGTGEDLKAGVDLPWYAGLSRFVNNSYDKFYWLRHLLSPATGWCRYDDDYGLGINPDSKNPVSDLLHKEFFKRLFYTVKCGLCICFCHRRKVPDHFWEYMNVAIFDMQPACGEYSGYNWNALAVGYGVFENWYFREYSDSSY